MHQTRLLYAGLTMLAICMQDSSQAPVPVTLAETLRAHVKEERFQVVTSIRGLPLGVRDKLQTLFGGYALDIAEPGAELKTRRLVRAGCSNDHCLVYYERGGSPQTWHLVLFHWTPDLTRVECGGIAPRGLASVDDVRTAVLSGAIKGPNKVW